MKKVELFELILGQCKKDPDPVYKILICRIRPKTFRIHYPDCGSLLDLIENVLPMFWFVLGDLSDGPDAAGDHQRWGSHALLVGTIFPLNAKSMRNSVLPNVFICQIFALCERFCP